MNWLKVSMEELVLKLKADYPDLTFIEGPLLCWSPQKKEIYYDPLPGKNGVCGVLHEIGHASLRHTSFESDIDLLRKEIEAWEEARRIGAKYGINLDPEHIQDCLDTYRDWLHKRSTCPKCNTGSLQISRQRYNCISCGQSWHVTMARLFRPYRLSETNKSRL